MTVNYKIDAVSEIRKYLWDQMISEGIFDIDEYHSDSINGTIVPIIPVQQSPELNQFLSGKKHIVYDRIGSSFEINWVVSCEQMLLTIYSPQIDEINQIRNFIMDLFRRMDESAQDVNKWESLSNKIKFHSIYIVDISATAPSEEIQGFLSSDIVLELKYSRMIGPDGRYL